MVRAWRIAEQRHLATAFSGQGAEVFGGRWNSPGSPMVYTSGSIALATLELRVNLANRVLVPWVLLSVSIAARLFEHLPLANLPTEWRTSLPVTRQIGDSWLREKRSVVLAVPSVVIPLEWNYLINPKHADFARLRLGAAEPFELDARLFAGPAQVVSLMDHDELA